MNKLKKALAVLLSVITVFCFFTSVASAGEVTAPSEHDYTITNPYETVDWDTFDQYKASLHSHTNVSDGVPTVAESVEKHYELGFDILAISDHAVLGTTWTNEKPNTVPLYRLVKFGNSMQSNLQPLSQERYEEITTGVGRDGRGMLEVLGGIEANGATPINDCHVNALFADFGQALMGIYGDYETVVKQVGKRGGITFLDHVGEYVGCEDDPDMAKQPYYINKLANIFLENESCVAMDINSGVNNRTRYDYILWDEVLKMTIPYGRNVSCITFSDGHLIDQYDRAFTMMCMPSNTVENLRTCLENGAYFSIGRHARADLGEDFVGVGPVPKVTRLNIDQDNDSISFNAEEFNYVRWYSDGEIIAEGENLTALDLDEYSDKIGCYVRFTLTGPGGILYSQAFPVTAPDIILEQKVIVPTFDMSVVMRALSNFFSAVLGWTPIVILIRWLLWGRVWWVY